MTRIDPKALTARAAADLELVVGSFREKGAKHFARPLVIGSLLILVAHLLGYKPAAQRLRTLGSKLAAARAAAQYADTYEAARDKLASIYSQTPQLKDRDQWLLGVLVESLKADGIVTDTLQPVTEMEDKGVIFQRASMSSTLNFKEIVRWIARIESTTPTVFIESLSVTKRADPIGQNTVNSAIVIAIPRNRLTL